MLQDAHTKWEHREIPCRLYKHATPDGHRWTGYAKIGDEWIEAVDERDIEQDKAKSKVESFVQIALIRAKGNTFGNDDNDLDPIDPDPCPCPSPTPPPSPRPYPGDPPTEPWDPDPVPIKPGPIWIRTNPQDITTDNTTTVEQDDDSWGENISWDGEISSVTISATGDETMEYLLSNRRV